MISNLSEFDEVNILASGANWAWPNALGQIFRPRGVNLLVANTAEESVDFLERKRIQTAIVDMDSKKNNGLAAMKIIRMDFPQLPCILLKKQAKQSLLDKALILDVFSVIDKPVNLELLREQLNRLFIKKYNSNIFAA